MPPWSQSGFQHARIAWKQRYPNCTVLWNERSREAISSRPRPVATPNGGRYSVLNGVVGIRRSSSAFKGEVHREG